MKVIHNNIPCYYQDLELLVFGKWDLHDPGFISEGQNYVLKMILKIVEIQYDVSYDEKCIR